MISVCVATYNGAKYINEQIDSILKCLGPDDEIVVSDDGSTDETMDILRSYQANDRRFQVLSGMHRGVIGNFSAAISAAKGDYIFLADQDDIWRSNKIDAVMECFKVHPSCLLVTHNARLIDEKGTETTDDLFALRSSRSGLLKNIIKNSYVGCCMAFRRALLPCILPIPANIEMHDWWIGLWADMRHGSVFLADELIGYRRHDANVSSLEHHPLRIMLRNRIVLAAEIAKRLLLTPAVREGLSR